MRNLMGVALVLCACSGPEQVCPSTGNRWHTDEITFMTNMDDARAERLEAAVAAWVPHFRIPMTVTRGEVDFADDGVNAVLLAPLEGDQLGLATVTSLGREIVEVDIRINSLRPIGVLGEDPMVFDLQSVLTHELGHAIGLDECPGEPEATMFPVTQPGETKKRSLSGYDIAAAEEQ